MDGFVYKYYGGLGVAELVKKKELHPKGGNQYKEDSVYIISKFNGSTSYDRSGTEKPSIL